MFKRIIAASFVHVLLGNGLFSLLRELTFHDPLWCLYVLNKCIRCYPLDSLFVKLLSSCIYQIRHVKLGSIGNRHHNNAPLWESLTRNIIEKDFLDDGYSSCAKICLLDILIPLTDINQCWLILAQSPRLSMLTPVYHLQLVKKLLLHSYKATEHESTNNVVIIQSTLSRETIFIVSKIVSDLIGQGLVKDNPQVTCLLLECIAHFFRAIHRESEFDLEFIKQDLLSWIFLVLNGNPFLAIYKHHPHHQKEEREKETEDNGKTNEVLSCYHQVQAIAIAVVKAYFECHQYNSSNMQHSHLVNAVLNLNDSFVTDDVDQKDTKCWSPIIRATQRLFLFLSPSHHCRPFHCE